MPLYDDSRNSTLASLTPVHTEYRPYVGIQHSPGLRHRRPDICLPQLGLAQRRVGKEVATESCRRSAGYCSVIKYSWVPWPRGAGCCAALFNSTSGCRRVLVQAETSVPSGSWKRPQLAGMWDNWITCMCQILLINRTGAAGNGRHSWLVCQVFFFFFLLPFYFFFSSSPII